MLSSHQYIISANEILDCSGEVIDVNDAKIKFKTNSSMTCQCSVVWTKNARKGFTFKSEVKPNGRVPNVCVSNVGNSNKWTPLKKTKCFRRHSIISEDPTSCGPHTCIAVFFEDDGSCTVRFKGNTQSQVSLLPSGEFIVTCILRDFVCTCPLMCLFLCLCVLFCMCVCVCVCVYVFPLHKHTH